jgi:hypothetical protein
MACGFYHEGHEKHKNVKKRGLGCREPSNALHNDTGVFAISDLAGQEFSLLAALIRGTVLIGRGRSLIPMDIGTGQIDGALAYLTLLRGVKGRRGRFCS